MISWVYFLDFLGIFVWYMLMTLSQGRFVCPCFRSWTSFTDLCTGKNCWGRKRRDIERRGEDATRTKKCIHRGARDQIVKDDKRILVQLDGSILHRLFVGAKCPHTTGVIGWGMTLTRWNCIMRY